MEVRLRYHVPLDVVVDIATGQVTSVTIIEDEMMALGLAYDHATDKLLSHGSPMRPVALAMAKEVEWPMWEFKE